MDRLGEFTSGLAVERKLVSGEVATGEYVADGTGVLHEWGASFPGTWEVKDEDQFCIRSEHASGCYLPEENTADTELYRVRGGSSLDCYS